MDESSLAKASRLWGYLLEHGELALKKGTNDLWSDYDDEDVRSMLNIMARENKLIIEKIRNTVYLVPTVDNTFLGFGKQDIREIVFKGNMSSDQYYLFMFIMLVIIQRFYSSVNGEPIRSSQSEAEIIDEVDKKLESFSGLDEEQVEFAVKAISQRWADARVSATSGKRDTKLWYVDKVINFLEDNRLVKRAVTDRRIYRQDRMDNLIHGFLTSRRYKELQEYLEKGGR